MNATTTPDAHVEATDLLAGLATLPAADDLTVGKDGFNEHFGYGYMTEAALFTAARATLAAAGLSATLSFEAGQHESVMTYNQEGAERPQIMATVTAVLTIRDKQGHQVECRAFGQGMDPADKAYYKAQTGAAKYVVQKALMIAVEADDADAGGEGRVAQRRGTNGSGASDKQLGFLVSLVKKNHVGTTEDAEQTSWRLARMAGDPAANFASIGKTVASDLIERLKNVENNPQAGTVILERLVAWETEQGLATTEPPTASDAPPTTDEIPFS